MPSPCARTSMPGRPAIREVDLQKRFPWTAKTLAAKLELATAKTRALRWKLGTDNDPGCTHDFVFGSQRHRMFSDNAHSRLRDALQALCACSLAQLEPEIPASALGGTRTPNLLIRSQMLCPN